MTLSQTKKESPIFFSTKLKQTNTIILICSSLFTAIIKFTFETLTDDLLQARG